MFLVYGLILGGLGVFGSSATKHKADGININLWAGPGMLVFGALMIFWALSRHTVPEPPETERRGVGPDPARGHLAVCGATGASR